MSRIAQVLEDDQFIRDVEVSARAGFRQWLANPNGLIVFPPVRCIYTVHDEQSARYISGNFGRMVEERLDLLIKQHKQRLL